VSAKVESAYSDYCYGRADGGVESATGGGKCGWFEQNAGQRPQRTAGGVG